MSDGTYVELNGKFTFVINQSGLDYDNKEERENAVKDFWHEWELFCEHINNFGFVTLNYNEDDLIVKEGE